jgi:hypothetical protein
MTIRALKSGDSVIGGVLISSVMVIEGGLSGSFEM